jgi:hypothetical protein
MTTKTLLMFATTSLLTPVALEGVAEAGRTTTSVMIPRPAQDTAPVANGRLRRTNEEQAGNEMPTVLLNKTGTKGYYFAMTTELPPTTAGGPVRRATDRVQLSMVPFVLEQLADGSVAARADAAAGTFETTNDGNEYRNANHPLAFNLPGTDIGCVEYNYQPNNSNDTERYAQCFNLETGAKVLQQTKIFEKNNDDASMNASGENGYTIDLGGGKFQRVGWRGANGNGADDGWLSTHTYTIAADGSVTHQYGFDVSLCPREERSHGNCSASAADPNTAICTWTEGNTQPQRDGTWIAAVDVTPGKFTGANRQASIIWKEQVDGRKDIDGLRTYSMRAHHERIMLPDTTGKLVATDQLLWYSNDLRGNNNENRKGGTVYAINMAVIKADKTGMSFVTPLTNMNSKLRGLGGTHLGMAYGVFGTTDALKPGVMFLNGSHTGGYFAGQGRTMTWDAATNTFADGGMTATAPNDRHLYPNYLGNNPGNQGRNYSFTRMVPNPFVGMNGNNDALLMISATTGKPMEEVGMPEYKTTAFLTISPVATRPTQATEDPTDPTQPEPTTPVTPEEGDDGGASDPGASLGGCSTGGSAGFASMLLIGLAAFIRRRR